jgi:dienelactone hydrolase
MHSENILYTDGNVDLEGYLAYQEIPDKKLPAVLIAHDWTGRNAFACEKAEQIAAMGYAGFALDMFGKGVLDQNNEEKSQLIQPLLADRALLQKRMLAALDTVKKLKMIDTARIAALGFCFGGLCVLDLARSGADIRGAVSFHGLLSAPETAEKHPITSKILALHGHDDPMVTPAQVAVFQQEMTAAGADWQMHIYGNTMHAFTNPVANDASFGTVYKPLAAQRSWTALQNFLAEVMK